MKDHSRPLDDDELTRLDDFLLDRLDVGTAEEIAAAGGDEGILDVTELDGLLTAIVSGPNVIGRSSGNGRVSGAAAQAGARSAGRRLLGDAEAIVASDLDSPTSCERHVASRAVGCRLRSTSMWQNAITRRIG
ncbi:MAG: hypothetical protein R3F58_01675 [Steroidobacteraceae bacterium]